MANVQNVQNNNKAPEASENILLRVENLCQYFKMGPRFLRAVDHVSFDIHKGEVFGLVGESGCGKTTTGRTIIKLYDATAGNVYFRGKRIVAGIRDYKENIKAAKKRFTLETQEIKAEAARLAKENNITNANNQYTAAAAEKIAAKQAEIAEYISEQREQIKSARFDHKNCDRVYAAEKVVEVTAKRDAELAQAQTPEQAEEINKRYKELLRIAKKERLVTQIQMIFQDPISSLDPRMTVKDIISEGLVIKGIKDKALIDKTVLDALEQVGLVAEHANRYPHEFSGGQRQRIGVARSIVMRPELIIADEPVSALDVSIQAQVINLLNDLRRELGLTILFIAHDLSVVKYFSDRIGVMYYGKMVELADADELFAHPLHPYTRSLLSAIPLPDPLYEKKRKRITYNPIADHDYSTEQPTLREIEPGHFILCNTAEFDKYKLEIAEKDSKKNQGKK